MCHRLLRKSHWTRLCQAWEEKEHKEWAKSARIIFPNQEEGDRGAHINISGGGVVKHSKRKAEAIKFLEYLVSAEAQSLYGEVNYEYPINKKFDTSKKLKALGEFREDKLLIEKIAKLAPKAQEIIDIVYWYDVINHLCFAGWVKGVTPQIGSLYNP